MISHGNGRLWLYRNDQQRKYFLNLLGSSAFKYRTVVHAFVLMKTHFHLLIETLLPNLSEFMRKLLSDYASSYNRWYDRRGSVFKSRYTSRLIQNDSYFHTVLSYIHYNPVKAGVVNSPYDYRWSSLYYLRHKKIAQKEVSWYHVEEIRASLECQQALADLTDDEAPELPIIYGKFIGDKEWADQVLSENSNRLSDEISRERQMRIGIIDPTVVIKIVATAFESKEEDIVSGIDNDGRKWCLYVLQKETVLDARRIGALFGMSKWAVLKTVQRIENSKKTKREMKILQLIKEKMSNVQT